jgi:hypothetical protein
MATAQRTKVISEIEKARLKLAEQQARIKDLEHKNTELENMEIVDIVRGMSIPLDDLASVLQSLKGGAISALPTTGQSDPKSGATKAARIIKSGVDESDTDKEDETE